MNTITTTIKREWLREIVAGRKRVEWEVITGLLYISPDSKDVHDQNDTVPGSLYNLPPAHLCPGNDALQKLQQSVPVHFSTSRVAGDHLGRAGVGAAGHTARPMLRAGGVVGLTSEDAVLFAAVTESDLPSGRFTCITPRPIRSSRDLARLLHIQPLH